MEAALKPRYALTVQLQAYAPMFFKTDQNPNIEYGLQ